MMKKKIQFTTLALSILCALGLVFVVHGSSAAQQSDLVADIVIPFTNSGTINPCVPEAVSLTGNINFRSHLTFDQAGGVHLRVHENTQGLSGTGLTTGAKYQVNSAEDQETNFKAIPAESTFTMHSNVIAQGTVPNFVFHLTTHVTINANGEVTAMVLNQSSDCK